MIPVARPDIGDEEVEAVTDVLRSGMLAGGKRVVELEERWADFIGTRHAIAVSNGTVALMAIFEALALGPGDEVITVGHTFNATVSSILFTGATPVFVDIEPDTYVIDAARIEAAITPRTKAICPVHLFGLPADMAMIQAIADRHGLAVVEDACQAHGAEFRGRRVGSFGHVGVQPVRHEEHDDRRGRPHHDRRRPPRGLDPPVPEPGHARAVPPRDPGLQLPPDGHRRGDRARPAGQAGPQHGPSPGDRRTLRRGASPTSRSGPRSRPRVATHVFHQYTIDVGRARDEIIAGLTGAPASATGIYYPIPVHRQPYVLERGIHADLPVTDRAAARTLSLPMYPGLTDAEQDEVIAAVRDQVSNPRATQGVAAG